jgi:hypothetical protein
MKIKVHLTIVIAVIAWGCANQTQPTGGPKDENPPILLSSSPENGALNFKGQVIELQFNEMIKEANLQSQLIITPSVNGKFNSKINRNKLQITFEKAFNDSTTYTLNFRESIKDVTESNSVENLVLVFSTGSYLDSLGISGNVITLLTNEPAANYTVAIYSANDTLNIFNSAPLYATQTNTDGDFQFLNIKSDYYTIYTWKDKNNDLKCQSESEPFAFLNEILELDSTRSDIFLKPFPFNIKPLTITSARQAGQYYEVRFSKRTTSYFIQLYNQQDSLYHHYIDENKAIRIYNTSPSNPEIQFSLTVLDSAEQKITDTIRFSFLPNSRPKEPFSASITMANLKAINSEFIATIEFTKPIKKFIDTLWTINLDSVSIPLPDFGPSRVFQPNPLQLQIITTLPDSLTLMKNLSFKMNINSLQSIESDTNTLMTKPIAILNPDNFGTIELQFPGDSFPFNVHLLSAKGVLQKVYPGNSRVLMEYLGADQYKIRVLIDANADGVWRPGNFRNRIMPEPVIFFYDQESKTDIITLKKNWVLGPFLIPLSVDN